MSFRSIILAMSFRCLFRSIVSKYLDAAVAAQERKREAKFFYTVFSAWDYGVNDCDSVTLQQKSVKEMLLVLYQNLNIVTM